jgi:hypothetical protein
MANLIRIKRRTTGQPGSPSGLSNAELAYNEVDDVLYYGRGADQSGNAVTIPAIGGPGAYMTLGTAQTVSGAKTFSGAVTFTGSLDGTTLPPEDSSTSLATTAFVKSLGFGSGSVTSVALSLPTGLFTVSGSPVTDDGTLSASLDNQSPNLIFAGPADGSANTPTFRSLVADDIPSIPASTISDFFEEVTSFSLDQFSLPLGPVSFNDEALTDLADPVNPQDAATKAYVDASSEGLIIKEAVRAATTSNISLNGTLLVDGVEVDDDDRVLVKNQNDPVDNGIYLVSLGGPWIRATDFDEPTDTRAGAFVFVQEGSQAGSGYVLTTQGAITFGTTPLIFTQFSGAGQFQAGVGLGQDGNTFEVVSANADRIVVDSNGVDLAETEVTPGTYTSVTVDAYGRIQDGSSPTTLSGYGITDAQPLDATLTALAGVATVADRLIYATDVDEFAITTFTSFGRSLVDDADAAAGRATLGLGSMATQNANNVAITGGTFSNITIDGGTF